MITPAAEPSRHRVVLGREPRGIGALSPCQGVWALPEAPVLADGVSRVTAQAAECLGPAKACCRDHPERVLRALREMPEQER